MDTDLLSCWHPITCPYHNYHLPIQPPQASHLKQTRRERHSSVLKLLKLLKLLKSVVALRQQTNGCGFPRLNSASELRLTPAPLGLSGISRDLILSSRPVFALLSSSAAGGSGQGWLQHAWNILTSELSERLDWTISARSRSMRDPCSAAKNTFMPNLALPGDRHPHPRPKWASPATCRFK